MKKWFLRQPYWIKGALLVYPTLVLLVFLLSIFFAILEGGQCVALAPSDEAGLLGCFVAGLFYVLIIPGAIMIFWLPFELQPPLGTTLFFIVFYSGIGAICGIIYGKIKKTFFPQQKKRNKL